ncbi:MAG TPA: hypothetical protein P5572_08060 [Phycisphaerae bacterium]|nr:hypothetical protein [Phycisphaerales bacterium]HRX84957.1 hypothetical protein [Phycisphaerae bacterium]
MEIRNSGWMAAMVLAAMISATAYADEPTPSTPSPTPQASPGDKAPHATSTVKDEDAPKPHRVYVDEDYDLQVAAPEGWERANPARFGSAGVLLRVWTPGSETAIMLYRVPAPEPQIPLTVLDQTAESLATNRNAAIIEQDVRKVAGMQAAWLVATGPGNGGAIVGQGVIPTTQHMVAIPRKGDTIVFMLGTPESKYATYRPVFEKMIESLKLGGEQTDAQKASS